MKNAQEALSKFMGGISEKPSEERPTDRNVPLWTFFYHRGLAHVTGVVEAPDERTAMRVAQVYCERNGYRAPASVQPMILATPAILLEPEMKAERAPLPSEIEATTGVNRG